MVRKQLYIEERQDRALKEMAKRTGRAEADLVREAIDRIIMVNPHPARDPSAWEESKRFIEERMRRVKVRPQGRTWPREELYERRGFH